MAISFGEKKPIATPGDVATNWPDTRNIDRERTFGAPTGHVIDGDLAIFVERSRDDANGRFDAVPAGFNATHVRQSCDKANGTVTAHSEITDVVEINHSSDARRIGGF